MMLFLDSVVLVFVFGLIVRGISRVADADWLAGNVEPSLRVEE